MNLVEFNKLSIKEREFLVDRANAWFCVYDAFFMKNLLASDREIRENIEVIKIVLGNWSIKGL